MTNKPIYRSSGNNRRPELFWLKTLNMNRSSLAVLSSSLYLLFFLVVLQTGYYHLTWILFLLSPFVLLYLVYSVLRYGEFRGTELTEDEEWGYEDVDREGLGTWG